VSDQTTTTGPASSNSFPCGGCGARVEYVPGTALLRCPYCGHEQQLVAPVREVQEHSYAELAGLPRKPVARLGAHVFVCQKCGATTQSDALADQCQFCGSPLVAEPGLDDQIAPEAVLPLALDRDGVRKALRQWVSSRWFAPGRLKKVTEAESTRGTYLPHWTFDTHTESDYDGQRGEHYWVTETYTVTVDGKPQTQTRQVQRTRWHAAHGTVARDFDDVLVVATGQVPPKQLEEMGPWPLKSVVPFRADYLAGHQALRYDVEPEAALETAKSEMAPQIAADCRQDIGGDEQRVHSVDTRYFDITYKLVLLPIWIACYLYAGRSWQVLINAQTGKVVGERPYSAPKIVATVLAGIAVVAALVLWYFLAKRG
jgi:DNA-directed RNA polymerase subunit RPC12/RpoP